MMGIVILSSMMIFGLEILQTADFFHTWAEYACGQPACCRLHNFFSQFASLRENVVFVHAWSLILVWWSYFVEMQFLVWID